MEVEGYKQFVESDCIIVEFLVILVSLSSDFWEQAATFGCFKKHVFFGFLKQFLHLDHVFLDFIRQNVWGILVLVL